MVVVAVAVPLPVVMLVKPADSRAVFSLPAMPVVLVPFSIWIFRFFKFSGFDGSVCVGSLAWSCLFSV